MGIIWPFVYIALGILLMTICGTAICGSFDAWMRKRYDVPKPRFRETVAEISPSIVGYVERAFFTALVTVNAAGYATAMVAWLALKLATSWTWKELEEVKDQEFSAKHVTHHSMRKSRIVSALTGMLSMTCALIAGLLIARGWSAL